MHGWVTFSGFIKYISTKKTHKPFDKDLIKLYSYAQKINCPIPSDECKATSLLWFISCYLWITFYTRTCVCLIYTSFSTYIILFITVNTLTDQHGMVKCFCYCSCWRRSVECKVINNDQWIAWKNMQKTDPFNCSTHQLILT